MHPLKSLSVTAWPTLDQNLFLSGLSQSSRRTAGGPPAQKSSATKSAWRAEYGQGLRWLMERDMLNEVDEPWNRWSPEVLDMLVSDMIEQGYALVSIHTRVGRIKRALQVMNSSADLLHFDRVRGELDRPKPRFDPVVIIVNSCDLKKLGTDLMAEARSRIDLSPLDKADLFRSGLQIAMLACRPWRRRAFTQMMLWTHLTRVQGAWRMRAQPEDTKNRRRLMAWVPDDLNSAIDEYIGTHRPILLSNHTTDALWVGKSGRAQSRASFYNKYCYLTEQRFGRRVTLQATRKIAATTIAAYNPNNVQAIQGILGHAEPTVGEEYYNMATAIAAFNDLDAALNQLARRRT